jgi:hypothetical protein
MSLLAELRDRLERMDRKLDGVREDLAELRADARTTREAVADHDQALDGPQGLQVRVTMLEQSQARKLRLVSAVWAVVSTVVGIVAGLLGNWHK